MNTKIALIGNMNNGHFALMRYFRDAGVDAHLFLYSNEHSHFLPYLDTTDWNKWSQYVSSLGVSNGGIDAMFGDLSGMAAKISDFDYYVGNGIAPVIFNRLKKKLDLFIPYGHGIEFVSEYRRSVQRPLSTAFQWKRKQMMGQAIQETVQSLVIGADHPNYAAFRSKIHWAPIVAKYDHEYLSAERTGPEARAAIQRMVGAPLSVFSQTQHRWRTELGGAHQGVGKRNNWLIEGFAKAVASPSMKGAVLCLLEYGPDVAASKELVAALGISEHVIWLPKMSRIELLAVARHADLGADAFSGILWGGTGWELISLGVPLLHYIDPSNVPRWSGLPFPPFLNASSPEAVADIIKSLDRRTLALLGSATSDWHNRYQGQALAKRYLQILQANEPLNMINRVSGVSE